MKDILERIAESSYTESSHELCCRLSDCAHEITSLRGALAVHPGALPEGAESLTDDRIDEIAQPFLCIGDGDTEHDSIDWRGFARALLAHPLRSVPVAEAVAIPQAILDALRFYAHCHHYNIDHQQYDTVSGEPQNWLFSEREGDCTMIEDGSVAKAALQGEALAFEEPLEPVEGEVLFFAPSADDAGVGKGEAT